MGGAPHHRIGPALLAEQDDLLGFAVARHPVEPEAFFVDGGKGRPVVLHDDHARREFLGAAVDEDFGPPVAVDVGGVHAQNGVGRVEFESDHLFEPAIQGAEDLHLALAGENRFAPPVTVHVRYRQTADFKLEASAAPDRLVAGIQVGIVGTDAQAAARLPHLLFRVHLIFVRGRRRRLRGGGGCRCPGRRRPTEDAAVDRSGEGVDVGDHVPVVAAGFVVAHENGVGGDIHEVGVGADTAAENGQVAEGHIPGPEAAPRLGGGFAGRRFGEGGHDLEGFGLAHDGHLARIAEAR